MVGTIKHNKREVPDFVKKSKGQLYDTVFLKNDKCTLTVYQAKVNKNVIVLSTMHSSTSISEDSKKKPETILYYNNTKYGVDVVDQMARKYSVKAGSRRWPVHVFYNILDLAAINAYVIYKEITGNQIKRRDFILMLCEELAEKYSNARFTGAETSQNICGESKKRRTCQIEKCENKTIEVCKQCQNVYVESVPPR